MPGGGGEGGVSLWNVAPTQERFGSVQHSDGFFLRVLSSCPWTRRGSRRTGLGVSKGCFTRVTCAHRSTRRFGEGGGGRSAPSLRASPVHIRPCAMEASAHPAQRRTMMTG